MKRVIQGLCIVNCFILLMLFIAGTPSIGVSAAPTAATILIADSAGEYQFNSSHNSFAQMVYQYTDVVHMDGIDDYLEVYVYHNDTVNRTLSSGETQWFMFHIGT